MIYYIEISFLKFNLQLKLFFQTVYFITGKNKKIMTASIILPLQLNTEVTTPTVLPVQLNTEVTAPTVLPVQLNIKVTAQTDLPVQLNN